jgi:hypothetical protein
MKYAIAKAREMYIKNMAVCGIQLNLVPLTVLRHKKLKAILLFFPSARRNLILIYQEF